MGDDGILKIVFSDDGAKQAPTGPSAPAAGAPAQPSSASQAPPPSVASKTLAPSATSHIAAAPHDANRQRRELPPEEDERRRERVRSPQDRGLLERVGYGLQIAGQAGVPGTGVAGRMVGTGIAGQVVGSGVGGLVGMPSAGGLIGAGLSLAGGVGGAAWNQASGAADTAANYSPMVAMAQAQAQIRSFEGEMRRSHELAPELSAFTEAKSKMKEAWEDLLAKFLKAATPVMTKLAEWWEQAAKGFGTAWDIGIDIGNSILSVLEGIYNFIATKFGKEEVSFGRFGKTGDKPKEDPPLAFIDQFLKSEKFPVEQSKDSGRLPTIAALGAF